MIKGVHAMFYTPQAEELRAFIRDKLGLPFKDVGDGWLIFDPSAAEIGCHPADRAYHEISFYCDDIHQTVADLKVRGVEFTSDVTDEGYGLVTRFRMPGGHEVELYQPKYAPVQQ
ncbi:MAG: extradiol dioxygenase [Armatimonadetes bacterium]|nr:extradiol dioxygenase [Armatimonadota bacterium]